MKQESVYINNTEVPIIKYEEATYYPISFIFEKVLLRKASLSQLTKQSDKYLDYIKKFDIDYGFTTGGIQNVYCISKNGLKEVLSNGRIGGLSVDQRIALNEMRNYLGMELVNEKEKIITNINKNIIKEYPIYIQDIINSVLEETPNIIWQKCTKCNTYYPLHNFFFHNNVKCQNGYLTICNDCQDSGLIKGNIPKEFINVYKSYGENIYKLYKNHSTVEIFKHFLHESERIKFPQVIKNKKDYLIIIKYLYDIGEITKDNITIVSIEEKYKIPNILSRLSIDEIYFLLFGNHPKKHPWHYPYYRLRNISDEEAIIIFKNYLSENKIIINDIFDFPYYETVKKCQMVNYLKGDILSFVVKYHNYKYPGYKFKISSINYWKSKENRIRDLKYFIEKDMKIPIEKIPLYLTKMCLQKNARTLYMLLYNGRYYKNIYEWVNDCYPNKFIEADFIVNAYRDEFDSEEEMLINEYLHTKYNNVVYNQRNTDKTIKIKGMIPDWLIFTDSYCCLVEYFGLYVKRDNNKRIDDYIKRANEKMSIYKSIDGYQHMFIFPEDLDHNMEGLKNKINNFS